MRTPKVAELVNQMTEAAQRKKKNLCINRGCQDAYMLVVPKHNCSIVHFTMYVRFQTRNTKFLNCFGFYMKN